MGRSRSNNVPVRRQLELDAANIADNYRIIVIVSIFRCDREPEKDDITHLGLKSWLAELRNRGQISGNQRLCAELR